MLTIIHPLPPKMDTSCGGEKRRGDRTTVLSELNLFTLLQSGRSLMALTMCQNPFGIQQAQSQTVWHLTTHTSANGQIWNCYTVFCVFFIKCGIFFFFLNWNIMEWKQYMCIVCQYCKCKSSSEYTVPKYHPTLCLGDLGNVFNVSQKHTVAMYLADL